MSKQMQFNADFNEVASSNSGVVGAERAMQATINRGNGHMDIGALSIQAAGLVTQYQATKKAADSESGKAEWLKLSNSSDYLNADSTKRAGMIEDARGSYSGGSEAFQTSFMSYSSGAYATAFEGRAVEGDNRMYNASGSTYNSWMESKSDTWIQGASVEDGYYATNREVGNTPQDFVDNYTAENPRLDKVVVSRALLADAYQTMVGEVTNAPATEAGLASAMANIEDIKAPYNTPMFLTTKQKQGQEYINALERELNTSIKLKQAEIKETHFNALAENAKSGYRMLPSVMEEHINATASNSYTAEKQKIELREKYEERVGADVYAANNPIGSKNTPMPEGNSFVKEERKPQVTKALMNHFSAGNYEEFNRVAVNEAGLTEGFGDAFVLAVNNAKSTKELTPLLDRFVVSNASPQGATLWRQSISDDEYNRINSLYSTVKSRPDWDLKQALDFVDETKSRAANMQLDPNKKGDMLEYASDLGDEAGAYLDAVEKQMIINPNIGKKEFKDIAKRFKTFTSEPKEAGGLTINTSMGSNPADLPSVMSKENFYEVLKYTLPEGTTSVHFLPDGYAVAKDKYSGTIRVLNLQKTEEYANNLTTANLITEQDIKDENFSGENGRFQQFKTVMGTALSGFGRTFVDNVASVPGGAADVVGTLSNRLGQHMYDSMTPDQQEWWSTLTEDDKSEVAYEALEVVKEENDVAKSFTNVNNMTMQNDGEAIKYAMQNGQIKMENAEKAQKLIQPITKYDEFIFGNEGGQDPKTGMFSPYESLETPKPGMSKYTIGRGHVITKAELKAGKVHGIDITKPLTPFKANAIYLKDKKHALDKLGATDLPESSEYLLLDVAHRAGGGGVKNWKFTRHLKEGELGKAFEQLGDMYYTDSKGVKKFYNKRNFDIFKNIAFKPSTENIANYYKLQEKAKKKGG